LIFSGGLSFQFSGNALSRMAIKNHVKFSKLNAFSWESNWEIKTAPKDELQDLLATVVCNQLDAEKENLKLETDLSDLDADSVDVVAILNSLESEFKKKYNKDVGIPNEKLGSVKKFGDLMNVVYDSFLACERK
jgi:acyl carrier protein